MNGRRVGRRIINAAWLCKKLAGVEEDLKRPQSSTDRFCAASCNSHLQFVVLRVQVFQDRFYPARRVSESSALISQVIRSPFFMTITSVRSRAGTGAGVRRRAEARMTVCRFIAPSSSCVSATKEIWHFFQFLRELAQGNGPPASFDSCWF